MFGHRRSAEKYQLRPAPPVRKVRKADNHLLPDPNKIMDDPMLVNPGSGGNGIETLDGYKLQAISPCIGAGTNTGIDYDDPNYINGGLDFWGNQLPDGNAPDVGAHQFSN